MKHSEKHEHFGMFSVILVGLNKRYSIVLDLEQRGNTATLDLPDLLSSPLLAILISRIPLKMQEKKASYCLREILLTRNISCRAVASLPCLAELPYFPIGTKYMRIHW